MKNIKILLSSFILLFFIIISASSCSKEVSVSQPDSLPPSGYVFIDSNPKGFHIYLNNEDKHRVTPDSLKWINSGTYLITLKKDLFRDSSVTVNVTEGNKQYVFIDYYSDPSLLGSIVCLSNPSGSEIYVNDVAIHHATPYQFAVKPGRYSIKYRSKNYRDAGESVTVSSGKYSTVKLTLVDTTLWEDYTISNSEIPSSSLTCISMDKENILYIGTSDVGLFSFDTQTKHRLPYYNSLSNNINCITFKNNIFYIGTTKGLVVFNGSSLKEYGQDNSNLPAYNIYAIAVDNDKHCYLGTDKGIIETHEEGGIRTWSEYNPRDVNGKKITAKVTALAVDNSNNLWAGINNYGIAECNPTGTWTFYTASSHNIINNSITALASSILGEVWAGFNKDTGASNGLSYFSNSIWNNVYPIPASNKTNSILIGPDKLKWISTDKGLARIFSPLDVTIFNYDNTGLDITNVKGVVKDSYGNIWIASSSGLFKYKSNHTID